MIKNLVLFQPGVHFLSKLQVLKADCGFEGNKVDKLFLDGVGLQVDSVLIDVGGFGNVGDLVNQGVCGITGLDAGVGIHHQGCCQEHDEGRNWVDTIIGSERGGDFNFHDIFCHFCTTEHETFIFMGGSICIGSATRMVGPIEGVITC